MRGETFPSPALIAAAPDFTARAAEVNTHRIIGICRHSLSLDGQPSLHPRQPGGVALPRLAAIDRAIHGRLASRRYARPNAGSVHREYPQRIRIACVENHRESDRPDALGHGRADVLPAIGGPVETIDAAVILLIEAVGHCRVHSHAVRVVTIFG